MSETVNAINKQIGANLRRARAAKGMSRQELGALLTDPVTQQAIDKYEAGKMRLSASAMVEIATVLGCSIADLFEGVDKILAGGEVNRLVLNSNDEKLLAPYHRIKDPEVQAAIRTMVQTISTILTKHLTEVNRNAKL